MKHTQGYRYFIVCLAVMAVWALDKAAQSWSSFWILLLIILVMVYVMEKYDLRGERIMADTVAYAVALISALVQILPLVWYVWGKNRRTRKYRRWQELPKWRLWLTGPAVFGTALGFAVGAALILVPLFIFEKVKEFSRWLFTVELPPEEERGECTSCPTLSSAVPFLGCSSLGECPYPKLRGEIS